MVKWALLNILLAFATGIIAILSASRHKDVNLTPYEKRKVYLAKSIPFYYHNRTCRYVQVLCVLGRGFYRGFILSVRMDK